jgi:hypothetical protein
VPYANGVTFLQLLRLCALVGVFCWLLLGVNGLLAVCALLLVVISGVCGLEFGSDPGREEKAE